VSGIPGGTRTYPPIKDFGLIGDLHTAALVSKNGAVGPTSIVLIRDEIIDRVNYKRASVFRVKKLAEPL